MTELSTRKCRVQSDHITTPAQVSQPFTSLGSTDVTEFLEEIVCPLISEGSDAVEDVLPATDLQRWIVNCNLLKSRGWMIFFAIDIKGPFDTARLNECCNGLIDPQGLSSALVQTDTSCEISPAN